MPEYIDSTPETDSLMLQHVKVMPECIDSTPETDSLMLQCIKVMPECIDSKPLQNELQPLITVKNSFTRTRKS